MEGSSEGGSAREELEAEARRLEAEAIVSPEDGPADRTLLQEAAAVRRQALGDRVSPVLVCSTCFRLTGWLDAQGRCDDCLRRAQVEAQYSDPHGGWVTVADGRAPVQRPEPLPLGARLAALFGRRGPLE